MDSASMLLIALIWTVNAVVVSLAISMHLRFRTEESEADLLITEYEFGNGEWVKV